MAARGATSKEIITQKILETFEGSFLNGKEIRIPMQENGERIEIKVALTAAKENVGNAEMSTTGGIVTNTNAALDQGSPHLTEQELTEVNDLLKSLGF